MLTNINRTIRTAKPGQRRGITLVEVLISMGILTVGLLGVIAMFPVGSFFMRKGEIADRGSAIGQAAFAEIVSKGDINPERWQGWNGSNAFESVTANMRGQLLQRSRSYGDPAFNAARFQVGMNNTYGFVYVIDPFGMAKAEEEAIKLGELNNGFRTALSMAPFNARKLDREGNVNAAINDERATAQNNRWAQFGTWPVRRVTTHTGRLATGHSLPVASKFYGSADDLDFSPSDAGLPTSQRFVGVKQDNRQSGPNLTTSNRLSYWSRENNGNYTWMISVAPSQSQAREALALDPSAYYYDVSVIVFYKRSLATVEDSSGNTIVGDERLVGGEVISTGTGGGEMLLSKLDDNLAHDPYEQLRQGQWVMVSGPHPSSTVRRPLFFTQWYRVLSIDDDGQGLVGDINRQRLVGLRGPDWPWPPGSDVRVGIFPGAVAVHTKSIRLDGLGAFRAE